jgi:hypothetical protein
MLSVPILVDLLKLDDFTTALLKRCIVLGVSQGIARTYNIASNYGFISELIEGDMEEAVVA